MENNQSFIGRKLLKNFLSLFILQMANYIFPLISFPYLVRVLGPDKFGLVSFATAFTAYFIILTDYGFNLSATQEISHNRDNYKALSKIFTSVIIIKFCIAIVSLGVLVMILTTLSHFRDNANLYLINFGSVIGSILFPGWFFQGLEKMKYISLIGLFSKSIATLIIFLSITKESDYLLVAEINSFTQIMIGIISQLLVRYKFRIKLIFPGIPLIIYNLKEGWQLFISSIAITAYTTSTAFILGLFTNNTIVGYYSAADKIRIACQGIISTVSQTIYPHVANISKSSSKEDAILVNRIFIVTIFAALILSLILNVFSYTIVSLVLGEEYINSVKTLKILSWVIFLVSISNILGIQIMTNFGLKSLFSKIIITSSLISLILSVFIVPRFLEVGSAFAVLISESAVSSFMIGYFLKNKNTLPNQICTIIS